MESTALAWTQALAAVVQAVGAVVIYLVTRDSLRVSRDMARFAADQLQLARLDQLATQKQRATSLRGLSQSLEARVTAIPDRADDTAFRERPLWTDGEIEALQTSAAHVLGMAADAASVAAIELTWIRDRLMDVRRTTITQGFDYARFFNQNDWRERRGTALAKLRELIQYAVIVADQADGDSKALRPVSTSHEG